MGISYTVLGQKITGISTFSGSVPAGGSVAYAFSATGAKAGKVLTGDPAVDITPLSISSRVTTANTVTFTLQNSDPVSSHDPTGVQIPWEVDNA